MVGSASDCRSGSRKFESQLNHITFMVIYHGFHFYGHSPASSDS